MIVAPLPNAPTLVTIKYLVVACVIFILSPKPIIPVISALKDISNDGASSVPDVPVADIAVHPSAAALVAAALVHAVPFEVRTFPDVEGDAKSL
jgi:hypothetical protein